MSASTPPPINHESSDLAERPRKAGLSHPLPAGMRDLLPQEARRQQTLTRAVLACFERFGYEIVSVPPFEYADVLEQDMGAADAGQVLRFVEPETGEIVALRPDMTPQVARLVATRLSESPPPVRLCYEGAVVRRRRERARRDRQLHQAGIELMGLGGPVGDLEVLSVACSTVREAGLGAFTLDLGHAMIAASLLTGLSKDAQHEVVDALSNKDADEVKRRAEKHGIRGRTLAALCELSSLYGGLEIWQRARPLLTKTNAEGPARELENLCKAVREAELAPDLVIDLGETWSFSYYTGAMFRVLAEGPGEPVGSGGRYDRLFDRFSISRPAAGFAIDIGNLGWAMDRAGAPRPAGVRVLVTAAQESDLVSAAVLTCLRGRGIACARAPESDPLAYAREWRFSHILEVTPSEVILSGVDSGSTRALTGRDPETITHQTAAALREAQEKG